MNRALSNRFTARLVAAIALVAVVAACAAPPPAAAPTPASTYAGEPDLLAKAARLRAATWQLVDRSGLLLYRARLPLQHPDNYRVSHDLADVPAWQGYLLAATAFEAAVTGSDHDTDLLRLARGLAAFHTASGVKGLLGRSMLADYTGPRLHWMTTEEERPTRFWMRGPTGVWWRNGLPKANLTLACFGCAVALHLHRAGAIRLRPTTEQTLRGVLLPAVRNLVAGGYRIRDWDGRFTEFGDLRPQGLNGFNMLVVSSMLASAAPYDAEIAREYAARARAWAAPMGTSLATLGRLVRIAGHRNLGKPSYSDMQTAALAALGILLQDEDPERRHAVQVALAGLWRFTASERNAPFTLTYAALVAGDGAPEQMAELLEDLRAFPSDKTERKVAWVQTDTPQPLARRPLNTNYWKSSPYRRVEGPVGAPTGRVYGGQDYLLAYWLGRYLKLLPER